MSNIKLYFIIAFSCLFLGGVITKYYSLTSELSEARLEITSLKLEASICKTNNLTLKETIDKQNKAIEDSKVNIDAINKELSSLKNDNIKLETELKNVTLKKCIDVNKKISNLKYEEL